MGATAKLKEIAEKKKVAAYVQNAILDAAEENGLVSDALAKGKIKYAKANDSYAEFGTKLTKAQDGVNADRVKFREIFESEMKNQPLYKTPEQIANRCKTNIQFHHHKHQSTLKCLQKLR
jgi:hypothetical protein